MWLLPVKRILATMQEYYPFASIGQEPQDLKFKGEDTTLKIGSDCMIREGVTINTGTKGGGSETVIGDRCVSLANSHIAHDCVLGNNIILSNNVYVGRPLPAR